VIQLLLLLCVWLLQEPGRPLGPSFKKPRETNENSKDGSAVYSCLLKNEVLGYQYEDYKDISSEKKLTPNRKLFHVCGTTFCRLLSLIS
jgi:hypothetical protein